MMNNALARSPDPALSPAPLLDPGTASGKCLASPTLAHAEPSHAWSSRAAPWSSRAVAGPCAGQADSTATRGRGASPCEGVSSHRGATADGIQSLPLEEAVVYRRLADHDRDRRMGRPMAPRSATDARPDSVSASEPAVRARPVRRPICMRIEQADGASLLGLRGRVRSVAGEFYSFKASTHRPGCSGLNMVTSARLASGPSRHNLLTRTLMHPLILQAIRSRRRPLDTPAVP